MDAHHPDTISKLNKKTLVGDIPKMWGQAPLSSSCRPPYFEYASTLTLYATQKAVQSAEERICWCKVPSNYTAGVTQPPWLHQFRLRWTSVHPSYWTSGSQKGRVKKINSSSSNSQFVVTSYYPCSTNYAPSPLILQWQNLNVFSTKLIIIGKTYISSWLHFSNHILFQFFKKLFWKVSQILFMPLFNNMFKKLYNKTNLKFNIF
jgi:hypothetical protein